MYVTPNLPPILNRSHPLFNGLIFDCPVGLFNGRGARDLVTGMKGVYTNSPDQVVGKFGRATRFDSSGEVIKWVGHPFFDNKIPYITVQFISVRNSTGESGYGGWFGICDSTAGTPDWFSVGNDNGDAGWGIRINTFYETIERVYSHAYPTNNRYHNWIYNYDHHDEADDDLVVLKDGVSQALDFRFNSGWVEPITVDCFLIGNGNDNTSYMGGAIALARVWKRRLSAKEMALITADPWILYRPQPILAKAGIAGTPHSQTVNEIITVTDSISKQPTKLVNETITLVETVRKTTQRNFNEAIAIVDSISKQPTKILTEAITLVDSQGKALTRNLNETVTVQDSVSKQPTKVLKDAVRVNDGDEIFKDNFGGALDQFTANSGTWVINSAGELVSTSRAGFDWASDLITSNKSDFTDFEILVKVKAQPGEGVQVVFRSGTTTGSGYGIQLRNNDDNFRLENWGAANLQNVAFSYVDNAYYWVRIRVIGTNTKARIWEDGDPEPGTWDIDYTGTEHASGRIGFSQEAAVNGAFDNLQVFGIIRGMKADITRPLLEGITISETISKQTTRNINETVTVVDTVSKQTTRPLNETITIVDTLTRSITRPFTETITVVASLAKTVSRSWNEAIAITDTIRKDTTRNFNEEITVTDSVSKQPQRNFSENITVEDTLQRDITKNFNETITVNDQLQKALTRSFVEVITLVERFSAYIPQRLGRVTTWLTQGRRQTSLKQKNNTVILKQKK